jgi:hypothetical protein
MTNVVALTAPHYSKDGKMFYSPTLRNAAERFFQSHYWHAICGISQKFVTIFTRHPAQTNETYLEHLLFTVRMSLRFILVSLFLFTHGLFPFLFTRTASKQIETIYLIMRSRIPKTRRDIIETEYDI